MAMRWSSPLQICGHIVPICRLKLRHGGLAPFASKRLYHQLHLDWMSPRVVGSILSSILVNVGRVPRERLDAVVHLQSPRRSILCRLFKMLRRIFGTCKFPPTDFHNDKAPRQHRRGRRHRTRRYLFSHAQHFTSKTILA